MSVSPRSLEKGFVSDALQFKALLDKAGLCTEPYIASEEGIHIEIERFIREYGFVALKIGAKPSRKYCLSWLQ